MKILLILPAGDEFRVTSPNAKIPKRKFLRFSLLPLTIVAALTPEEHTVTIIDENVEYLDFSPQADLIGISFMTALAPRAYAIAAEFRARGIPVVAGGYHPTFCPDEAALHFDAVVVGEAELHWKNVIEDCLHGRLKKMYAANRACDPADIPVPRRKLTVQKAKEYVTINAVQTGRGCHNKCKYCSITRFHNARHRSRPIENVISELAALPKNLMFIDDNIIADKPYIAELFRRMSTQQKRWASQCSIDLADDEELLSLARRAGCFGLFIGIESLNQKNLEGFDKKFNAPESYVNRLRKLQKSGILVFASIIVGGDEDTVDVFPEMLRFLQNIHAAGLQLNIMTPLPGTPLFQQLQTQGRVTDYDWSKYDFRHVVMQPARMSQAELQRGADWLYVQFYRLDRIILRAFRILFTHGWFSALIAFRLGLTYRYDNRREKLCAKRPLINYFSPVFSRGLFQQEEAAHAVKGARAE